MVHSNCVINDKGLVEYYKNYRIPDKRDLIKNGTIGLYGDISYRFKPNKLTDVNITVDEIREYSELELNKYLINLVKRLEKNDNKGWGGF